MSVHTVSPFLCHSRDYFVRSSGGILTTGRDKCPFQINDIFLRESSTFSSLFAKSLNDYRLTLIFFWQMIGLRRAQLRIREYRTGPFQGVPYTYIPADRLERQMYASPVEVS